VWIWLFNDGPERIDVAALQMIEGGADATPVCISAISVWELAMLEAKGRIRLPKDCLTWVGEALTAPRLALLSLSPAVAVASTRLPGVVQGDPADRILIATARVHDLTLITRDARLLAYGAEHYVSTLRA
jgi:PIN domain nuclease of toxin-antitoxin system